MFRRLLKFLPSGRRFLHTKFQFESLNFLVEYEKDSFFTDHGNYVLKGFASAYLMDLARDHVKMLDRGELDFKGPARCHLDCIDNFFNLINKNAGSALTPDPTSHVAEYLHHYRKWCSLLLDTDQIYPINPHTQLALTTPTTAEDTRFGALCILAHPLHRNQRGREAFCVMAHVTFHQAYDVENKKELDPAQSKTYDFSTKKCRVMPDVSDPHSDETFRAFYKRIVDGQNASRHQNYVKNKTMKGKNTAHPKFQNPNMKYSPPFGYFHVYRNNIVHADPGMIRSQSVNFAFDLGLTSLDAWEVSVCLWDTDHFGGALRYRVDFL